MRTFFFLLALLFFLAPARNEFFDERCYNHKGKCLNSCRKNEEFVALCQKSLKCCTTLQPCGKVDNDQV